MSLLGNSIMMQSGANTATLEIVNFGGVTVTWTKNGVSQGTVSTTLTTTLNSGDQISVSALGTLFGANISYFLNGSFVDNYAGAEQADTPLIIVSAGNSYRFDCSEGI